MLTLGIYITILRVGCVNRKPRDFGGVTLKVAHGGDVIDLVGQSRHSLSEPSRVRDPIVIRLFIFNLNIMRFGIKNVLASYQVFPSTC